MEPLCSKIEASDVVSMAPSCSQSDLQRTLQTMEKKRKCRVKHDGACHAAETVEQKEHTLSNPRKKT